MEWIPIPSFAGNLKELGLEPVKAVAPKVVLHLKEMAVVAPVEDTRVSNQQISVTLAANLGLGNSRQEH
jgi:hypothetical protein